MLQVLFSHVPSTVTYRFHLISMLNIVLLVCLLFMIYFFHKNNALNHTKFFPELVAYMNFQKTGVMEP